MSIVRRLPSIELCYITVFTFFLEVNEINDICTCVEVNEAKLRASNGAAGAKPNENFMR